MVSSKNGHTRMPSRKPQQVYLIITIKNPMREGGTRGGRRKRARKTNRKKQISQQSKEVGSGR